MLLTVERWEHIADGHPEMMAYEKEVLLAVEAPTKSMAGREPEVPSAQESMSITIADITFDRVEYDAEVDVLYLSVGNPARAVDFDETPEGHAVRLDRDGNVVGLTLVRPKRLLGLNDDLRITLPVPSDVPAEQLAPAFV